MEVVVITEAKTCKAPARASPLTNQHPTFLQAGWPSCCPTNSVKSLKGKISHSMDLLIPSSPGGLPTLSLTINSSCNLGGGLPCLSSALWCQYPLCEPSSRTINVRLLAQYRILLNRTAKLQKSEMWPMKRKNETAHHWVEIRMIRWICGVRLWEKLSKAEIRNRERSCCGAVKQIKKLWTRLKEGRWNWRLAKKMHNLTLKEPNNQEDLGKSGRRLWVGTC